MRVRDKQQGKWELKNSSPRALTITPVMELKNLYESVVVGRIVSPQAYPAFKFGSLMRTLLYFYAMLLRYNL